MTLFGGDFYETYLNAVKREVDEEICVNTPYQDRIIALINDDSNAVGSVHLGVVHILELELPAVSSRESELVECGFDTLAALLAARERFETWSQIALDALHDGTIAV